jgi:hypothetical protein
MMTPLESVIRRLVAEKNATAEGSPERALCVRILTGLRYSYEQAGPLIEYYDPDWGSYCSPLPGAHIENITSGKPAGEVVPMRPHSKER